MPLVSSNWLNKENLIFCMIGFPSGIIYAKYLTIKLKKKK